LVGQLLEEDFAVTCGPILMELRRGLKKEDKKKVLGLLSAVNRVPVSEDDWEKAGDLDASLREKGVTVPPMDVLIARICIREKLRLYTLDTNFQSIPGLELVI
jgi:predicted nucleic acid-binding protein